MVVRMRDVLATLSRCYGVFTLLKVEFKLFWGSEEGLSQTPLHQDLD